MSLKEDLDAAAVKALLLESTLAEAGLHIAELEVENSSLREELAECRDQSLPPDIPIPDPPPDGHYVALTDDINAAVSKHPAGSTFILEPGERKLSEPLARKQGNRYFSDGATFTGPGAGGVPFLPVDVNGLVLQGIAARYFGPANTDQGAGMVDYQGGVDLLMEDCDFGYSNRSVVSGHNSWIATRCHFHHGGKYACQGSMGELNDCEFSWSGRTDIPNVVGWTASQDKGGCKWVKSKGMRIDGLHTHDNGGTGLWWDIGNEDWQAKNVISEDNARHGISMEVSYGPGLLDSPIVRRCGTIKRSGETNTPVPAGILVSLTPDVTVLNPTVEDSYNGLIVRSWAHPQSLTASDPNRIGDLERKRLGCNNVIFEGGTVKNSLQFDAGLHGPYQSGLRPSKNVHWNGTRFDEGAKFTSGLHIP